MFSLWDAMMGIWIFMGGPSMLQSVAMLGCMGCV